jgi:16S rRNA (guanine966-N2)-methyltransferase
MRESLFSILTLEIEEAVFIDAYAGTGAVGIEALSRGAARAVFIERGKAAADVIRQNLSELGLTRRAEVLPGRVLQFLPHREADIVFLDPPYELTGEYAEVLNILGNTKVPKLAVVQHPSRMKLGESYGRLQRVRVLKQGDNSLSFYRPTPVDPPESQ